MFNFENALYLQYWSAIFENPWVKSTLLLSLFMTVLSLFGSVYFCWTYLKKEGFEGFDWNTEPHNIDQTYKPMEW